MFFTSKFLFNKNVNNDETFDSISKASDEEEEGYDKSDIKEDNNNKKKKKNNSKKKEKKKDIHKNKDTNIDINGDTDKNTNKNLKKLSEELENINKEKKKVHFEEDEITSEELLNYFIKSYNNKINIENDELCQILTGKKYYDIERLAKNATEITHYDLKNKNMQKNKQSYCKTCGYIYNYDDYMYLFMKCFQLLNIRNHNEFSYDIIKCIYCGSVLGDIEILFNQFNNNENSIELYSYREKYIFDKNKKDYWKNKITSFNKNTPLFKEEEKTAYNITYEKCLDCGNDFLHFINIQTRSADEGSTIIYFCPNCKKQTTVNN
ncbi:transcription factor, putative [Plasmodium sp. DRC-Itaito]|uniref:Transcription factor, putative n=1 Tax=Plasmodium gaboni TaxID=647221 RepID=A0ABY1UIL1_9APIC|nr:transcription factor, putative [Plasmodium gaboni]SOV21048.1 transcription factor, putative [Plasmodium sp. DRC-Itaito]